MKDEIKEILNNQKLINVENDYERIIFEYLANNCSEFDDEHIKQLVNLKVEQYKQSLEYITNLQEENERLKELNICVGCENNPSYKLRNDKAIEYINMVVSYNGLNGFKKQLLNILGGDDNE